MIKKMLNMLPISPSPFPPFKLGTGVYRLCFILTVVGIIFSLQSVVALPVSAGEVTDRTTQWGTIGRGMGGAYTAAAGDIGGISYNPANSATLDKVQFVTDYSQLSMLDVDVDNTALALGFRGGDFVHGLGIYRTDLGFDYNSVFDEDWNYELDYTDDIFYYNLSWNLTENAHIGTNLKYYSVDASVEGGDATGYGVDLGYLHFIGDRLTLGLTGYNFVSERDWDGGTTEDLPLRVRAGLRAHPWQGVSVEAGGVYDEDADLHSFNLGGEWWIWEVIEPGRTRTERLERYFRSVQRQRVDRTDFGLALRAGAEVEQSGAENTMLTAGLGFKFDGGRLDYSYQQREDFDNQHFFGLMFGLGGSEEGEALIEPEDGSHDEYNPDDVQPRDEATFSSRVGLMQWQVEADRDFEAEELESVLEAGGNVETVVYDSNPGVEHALIEDRLAPEEIGNLVEATGVDLLVTGQLNRVDDQYHAEVTVASGFTSERFDVYATAFGDLLGDVASEGEVRSDGS